MKPFYMRDKMLFVKLNIYWDDMSIETFRTTEQAMKESEALLVIEDGGKRRVFNKRYIRKIEVSED